MDKIRIGVDRFTVHAYGALAEVQDIPVELANLRAEVEGFLAQILDMQRERGGSE
jgi:hypothetical protein